MAIDIVLTSPDGNDVITLGRGARLTQGVINTNIVTSLPGGTVLYLNAIDKLARTWTIEGYMTPSNYQVERRDLDDAVQGWHLQRAGFPEEGRSRLVWGKEPGDVNDYEFEVAFVNLVYRFTVEKPGTAALKYVEYTITLVEVPEIDPTAKRIGNLNAAGP